MGQCFSSARRISRRKNPYCCGTRLVPQQLAMRKANMEQSTRKVRRAALILGGRLCGILLSLTFQVLSIIAAHAHDPGAKSLPEMLTFREGKLSARIVATPLRQVMAAIRSLS